MTEKKFKKAGRKSLPKGEVKKMVPAYISDKNKKKIMANYKSITEALELEVLPKCL